MHRRTARGNRLGIALTGLVLMAGGAVLFAANRGWFGSAGQDARVYPVQARRFIHDHGSWLWPVVAAAAILVGLIFVRWLLVQPRTDRLRRLVIDSDEFAASESDAGRTRMPSQTITDVVEDDILAMRGVRRVSAALSGHADAPALWLVVATHADADVAQIRTRITSSVVVDARACLDLPSLPTYLTLVVTNRDAGRDVR